MEKSAPYTVTKSSMASNQTSISTSSESSFKVRPKRKKKEAVARPFHRNYASLEKKNYRLFRNSYKTLFELLFY